MDLQPGEHMNRAAHTGLPEWVLFVTILLPAVCASSCRHLQITPTSHY